ncbi:MAG: hypothetical protein J4F39_14230 [Candidatus Latescibacteria bacterium]|nr:hypothetical protein [Candidatus Latescibacterota bacterium]
MLYAGMILLVLSVVSTEFHAAPEVRRLNLFTLIMPALSGLFVGQRVGEIQYTLYSWTLPGMRRLLVSSVHLTGIATAVVTILVYDWLGGSVPLSPILMSGLLWYAMAYIVGTYEFLDAPSRLDRSSVTMILPIFLFVIIAYCIDGMAELYAAQPVLCSILTLPGALFCLNRGFAAGTARRKSLVSMPTFNRGAFGSWELATYSWRRKTTRIWRHAAPITGTVEWIRAGRYETDCRTRIGWLNTAILDSVGVMVVSAVMVWFSGPEITGVPVVVPIILVLSVFHRSLYVQKGWVYPLSRAQLARLAYWSSLLHNLVYCGIMLVAFFVLEGLAGIYAGLDLARPVILMFICIPVFQWVRLRYRYDQLWPYVVMALFVIGYSILIPKWIDLDPRAFIGFEVAAVIALVLLSQGLFRFKIGRYFTTADLV